MDQASNAVILLSLFLTAMGSVLLRLSSLQIVEDSQR